MNVGEGEDICRGVKAKVDEDEGIAAFETKEVFSAALIKETSVLSGNCLKTCLAQFFAGRSRLLILNLYAAPRYGGHFCSSRRSKALPDSPI